MDDLIFIKLENDINSISKMSKMATAIVKEAFDSLIGPAQNDYMISKFQTVEAITDQLNHGSNYYFVRANNINIGFIAFYPKNDYMYLSKFYLYNIYRGMGYASKMMSFIIEECKMQGINRIELNVNKNNKACMVYEHLGFTIARLEKNDIGCGFYMDDYVYSLDVK